MTVTAAFAPVFKYNGSLSGTAGVEMSIRFESVGGPWAALWPTNFNVWPGYQIGPAVTILTIWWNGTEWEASMTPVDNPA